MHLFCTNLPSINRMQYIIILICPFPCLGAIGNLMSVLFLLRLYLSIKHLIVTFQPATQKPCIWNMPTLFE